LNTVNKGAEVTLGGMLFHAHADRCMPVLPLHATGSKG